MYNYRLQLQYDGGRYDGWVRMGKDSNSNTIECKIKEIIQKMTGEDIDIYVGCRTGSKGLFRAVIGAVIKIYGKEKRAASGYYPAAAFCLIQQT